MYVLTEQEKKEQRELCETILKKEFSLRTGLKDKTVDMIMDLARKHLALLMVEQSGISPYLYHSHNMSGDCVGLSGDCAGFDSKNNWIEEQ